MLKLEALINQVRKNCSISDSRYAGFYSVCGLALRLRDLYKWEKDLEPWVEGDPSEVLSWIGEREDEWEDLTEREFDSITVLGHRFDPFDCRGINSLLEPHGFFYGAGYVHSLKPSFFLGALEDKAEIEGCAVYFVGRELARDLMTLPALSQDGCIIVRKESAKLFFWDQVFYVKKSGRHALRFALESCGVKEAGPEALRDALAEILMSELGAFIYHELGEIRDDVFDRPLWQEVIAAFPHTPIEVLARSVKDLLADTNECGTLRYIARERKSASLGFYVAFLEGLRKELFPQIDEAFKQFVKTGNWYLIEEAISTGYNTARDYAGGISGIFRKGRQMDDLNWAEDEIHKRLLVPLGVKRKG